MTSPRALWATCTRWVVAAGLATGGFLVAVGWLQAMATTEFARQLDATAVSGIGLACIGLTCLAWILAGRHALCRRRADTLLPIQTLGQRKARGIGRSTADSAGNGSLQFVASPSMGRFHRPTCLMVEGKRVDRGAVVSHLRAGRRPCDVCSPDE